MTFMYGKAVGEAMCETGRKLAGEMSVGPPDPGFDREFDAKLAAQSAVDCAHGIPMNLRCGACEDDMDNIDKTLAERGSRYGSYPEHARITQNIKAAMIDSPNWCGLADDQRETLEMVAHKIGRILNGDPNFHDSWHDINGYVKLVADRLLGEAGT